MKTITYDDSVWKLVPMEPTPEMREAFHDSYERYEDGWGECPDSQWKAMLRTAPTPPASEQQQAVVMPEPFMFVKPHAGDVMDWTQDPSLAEYWAEEGDTVAELYSGHDLRLTPNLQPAAPSQGE